MFWLSFVGKKVNMLIDVYRKHVLHDLRPYLCTYQDCPTADETYASRARFRNHLYHECLSHEREFSKVDDDPERTASTACAGPTKPKNDTPTQENAMTCIFCREVLSAMTRNNRAEHLGRHMEEIAFSVVTKPYEEWEFYSDDSTKADNYRDQTLGRAREQSHDEVEADIRARRQEQRTRHDKARAEKRTMGYPYKLKIYPAAMGAIEVKSKQGAGDMRG